MDLDFDLRIVDLDLDFTVAGLVTSLQRRIFYIPTCFFMPGHIYCVGFGTF